MNRDKTLARQESPAERLGILYVASFVMTVVLSGIGQFFILREISRQSATTASIVRLVGDGSAEHPLSLAALAVLAEESPPRRVALLKSFSQAVEQRQADTGRVVPPDAGGTDAGRPKPGPGRYLWEAETHRSKAGRAAETLLARLGPEGSARPPAAEIEGPLRRVLDEEGAVAQAVAEVARAAGAASGARLGRLERFEFNLFGLVVAVLALEGLFVVNPAVRKIRLFMSDLERSNEELKSYSRRLEASNGELQDFASVASHDLQEPLRKVQAFSDRLRSRSGDALDPQGLDYLDRVQNAAARMQSLINDLLTYARVATKAQPFVPTDLVSVTREVVSDLEARIEDVSGRVEVGELPRVDADPLQVRQLMQNLIGNALKYKRPDVPPVVKISATRLAPGAAGAAGGPSREFCQILIEDNGIGFEEVYAEKIFVIFQRLHGRAEYEGTGVGLAVCRKIVERHGGTITARGTPGRGSTFTVTLPTRQSKEKSPDVAAA